MAAENRTDFDQVVKKITQNYISDEVFVTKENRRLPGRSSIIILIKRLRSLMFPGYFEEKNFEYRDAQYFAGNTLNSIRRELRQQVEIALLYTNESRTREQIAQEADETAQYFIGRLADIQNMLLKDLTEIRLQRADRRSFRPIRACLRSLCTGWHMSCISGRCRLFRALCRNMRTVEPVSILIRAR